MKINNKYFSLLLLMCLTQFIWAQGPVLSANDACGVNASQGSINVDLSGMNNYPYTFSVELQQAGGEFEELLEYQQEISAGVDNFSFDDLEAGQYRVSAVDGCGCKWGGWSMLHAGLNYNDCLVTIEENCCSWTIESSSANASCANNLGSISLSVIGGSGNFDFEWVDHPDLDGQQDLTNLSSGIYIVTVTDLDWMCAETLTFNIKKINTGIAAQNDNFYARNVQYQDNSFGSESKVRVDIPEDRRISASLYTLSGAPVKSVLSNQILSTGIHTFDVDVSDLYDGMYILVGEVSCPDDSDGKLDTDLGIKNE